MGSRLPTIDSMGACPYFKRGLVLAHNGEHLLQRSQAHLGDARIVHASHSEHIGKGCRGTETGVLSGLIYHLQMAPRHAEACAVLLAPARLRRVQVLRARAHERVLDLVAHRRHRRGELVHARGVRHDAHRAGHRVEPARKAISRPGPRASGLRKVEE